MARRKYGSHRRDVTVCATVTQAERDRIQTCAFQNDQTTSDFVRGILLDVIGVGGLDTVTYVPRSLEDEIRNTSPKASQAKGDVYEALLKHGEMNYKQIQKFLPQYKANTLKSYLSSLKTAGYIKIKAGTGTTRGKENFSVYYVEE